MALRKIALDGGSGGGDGGSIYTAKNSVVVTSSAPTFTGNNAYQIGNLFNGTIPTNDQEAIGMFWMTNSSGNQSLVFDFSSIRSYIATSGGIKKIIVYPATLPGVVSSNYRILYSEDNINYTQFVGWVNNLAAGYGVENEHTVSITAPYIMFELTQNLNYGVALSEIEFYIEDTVNQGDVHYYVSQQNGSDTYDGKTPLTPWATITKAAQMVTNTPFGNVYIHIGPGTYREQIVMANSGIDLNHLIVLEGDPDCIHLAYDHPGIVRITGCDVNENPSLTAIFNFNNQKYVQLSKVWIDGVYNVFAIVGNDSSDSYGQLCRKIHIHSPYGFSKTTNYDCSVVSGYIGYDQCVNYNCVTYSGGGSPAPSISSGFQQQGCFAFNSCVNYNCLSIGGCFFTGTCYNCICMNGKYGFSEYTTWGGTRIPIFCYNCIAINCTVDALAVNYGGWMWTYAVGGSNNYSFGCINSYWPSSSISAIKLMIDNILNKYIRNAGTSIGISLPPTDIEDSPRQNGIVDIGPREMTDYVYDWQNFRENPPGIKITGAGEYIYKFPVTAGVQVIKSINVKTINTNPNLKPLLIIRGLGYEKSKTAIMPDGVWETLGIELMPERSGVMEMIIRTQDPNTSSYSIFSDPS